MFSLIITIVSIALAVLLAIATVYYGATTYNNWKATANATAITNQASQIFAAAQLYYNDHQQWPTEPGLLEGTYLAHIPLPPVSAIITAS